MAVEADESGKRAASNQASRRRHPPGEFLRLRSPDASTFRIFESDGPPSIYRRRQAVARNVKGLTSEPQGGGNLAVPRRRIHSAHSFSTGGQRIQSPSCAAAQALAMVSASSLASGAHRLAA